MIVDDDTRNVKLLGAILRAEGFEIIPVYGGEEAIERVKRDSPDLILLDVMMPNISGFEITRLLKRETSTSLIPIILVTALDGQEDKIEGLKAGAEEFISKPVNREELILRVTSLIRFKNRYDNLQMKDRSESLYAGACAAENSAQKDGRKEGCKPVILINEENEMDRKTIEAHLKDESYLLRVAESGEDTLKIAKRERVDVILLDILSPAAKGLQLCREIKSDEALKDIQILAMTHLGDLESRIKVYELGADDFLVKPINTQELSVRIRALLKKKGYIDHLKVGYERALRSAITDKLTGIYNYGYFEQRLKEGIKRTRRLDTPLSLLMIDVDDFKNINDTFGHLKGDEILKTVGALIRDSVREIDLAARYGGEEFSVILADTAADEAVKIAERIRKTIFEKASASLKRNSEMKISVSIGVASSPTDAFTMEGLIERADKALYIAKRSGKNRTCRHGE